MNIDNQYLLLLENILNYGYVYEDPNRKGTSRVEIPSASVMLKREECPIIHVRKSYFKGAVGELLCFLKGETDIRKFWEYGVNFWDTDWIRFQNLSKSDAKELKSNPNDYSDEDFKLGKIYGHQIKKQWSVFDKFRENSLRTDLLVDCWQIKDFEKMSLKPCHYSFQLIGNKDSFFITWNQRSTDALLGLPMNILYYSLMGLLLEQFNKDLFFEGAVGNLNKVHLYDNQVDLAKKLVKNGCDGITNSTYKVDVGDIKYSNFEEFINQVTPDMFSIEGYKYLNCETVKMLTYGRK